MAVHFVVCTASLPAPCHSTGSRNGRGASLGLLHGCTLDKLSTARGKENIHEKLDTWQLLGCYIVDYQGLHKATIMINANNSYNKINVNGQ